jgi:hypothetical protein
LVWAVLAAAGRGERLGSDRPKAFARLGGRPLLAESLERLEGSDWIERIVIAAPPGWEEPSILVAEEIVAAAVSENGAETPSEDGAEAPKPKKRTRRGSRGGRNRKKKPAGATAENGSEPTPGGEPERQTEPEPEAVAAAPSQTEKTASEGADWEYVPMSQWDDNDE